MEPLDPAKNVEGSGFSKRRISSILKVPQKSTVFRDSDQQKHEVESAKPVEKRSSRRVSFAASNDVLLFAKDVKTASPTRSPLQELMAATTATTPNRFQVAVTDEKTKQIMGIENLLKAPLHGSQQRNMVNSDGGNDFGEKTVMFSTEDMGMDMTCSHTINIASEAELLGEVPHQHHDILHTQAKRTVALDDGATDMSLSQTGHMSDKNKDLSSEMRNVSATVPFVNPDFENFLASLSKPSGSSRITPSTEQTTSKTQTADVDKENQLPKLLNHSKNIGEPFNRSAFCPEDDVSLGVTTAHDDDDNDDPFQCLFPTQDMYAHSDKRSSQTTQKSLEKSLRCSGSAAPKVFASFSKPGKSIGNPEIPAIKPVTALTSKQTISTDSFLLQQKTQKVDVGNESWSLHTSRSCGEPRNGGLICPEDDINMDMTEAPTGCISGGKGLNDPFQFHIVSQDSLPVCKSQKQAGVTSGQQSSERLGSSNHKGVETSSKTLLQTNQETLLTEDEQRAKTVRFSTGRVFMGVPQNHNDFKLQLHQSVNIPPPCEELPVRLTADDTAMDMTQCLTVNIASGLVSDSVFSVTKQEDKTFDLPQSRSSSPHGLDSSHKNLLTSLSSDCSGKTVITQMAPPAAQFFDGFTLCPEDDVSIDMNEGQTGCIMGGDVRMEMKANQMCRQTADHIQPYLPRQGTCPQSLNLKKEVMTSHQHSNKKHPSSCKENSLRDSVKPVTQTEQFELEDHCRDETVRFTAADACMDVTQSHMMNIISDSQQPSFPCVDLPANGEKTVRFTTNDAAVDMTRSHTVNISTDLNRMSNQNLNFLPANGDKTVTFTANDAAMDVTESHTVKIFTDLNGPSHQKMDLFPVNGEQTMRFTAADACMDVTQSHTMNISDSQQPSFPCVDLPANGEKTVRFTTNDAAVDMTRSHTVNISTDLNMMSNQSLNFRPANGDKTVTFSTNDAAMDVTRSHTVNISTDLNRMSNQNLNFLPANGDKTVMFTTNDAAMDVTRTHVMNIISDSQQPSFPHVDLPANGEKTVRFTTNDAAVDMTRSHTVNISTNLNMMSNQSLNLLPAHGENTMQDTAKDAALDITKSLTVNISTNFEPQLDQKGDFQPSSGDKTKSLTTHDASMDMTSCFTVNIASCPASDPVLPEENSHPNENMNSSLAMKKTDREVFDLYSNSSSSAQVEEEYITSMCQKSDCWANLKAEVTDTPLPEETANSTGFQFKTQRVDTNAETESPSLVSSAVEQPAKETMTDHAETGEGMNTTEPHVGGWRQTDNSHPRVSSRQDRDSELTSQDSEVLGSSIPNDAEIQNSLGSNEMKILREHQPRTETSPLSQKMEPNTLEQDAYMQRSRTSGRLSLADLQSKVKRLSHIIKAAPDTAVIDSCTVPLPQLDPDLDKNSKDKTTSLPAEQPELEMNTVNNTEAESLSKTEPSATACTTPFRLKTQQLMSRLSVGHFKPKLPQRNNSEESKKTASAGEITKTFTLSVHDQLNNFDDVGDINDEELGSYDDISETLDTSVPEKISEKESSPREFHTPKPLPDSAFQVELCSPVHRQKRLLQDGESKDDEKRLKSSTEQVETEFQLAVECDSNIATTHMTTQSTDSASGTNTSSRCEAAFDSTNKHSLFESQLEDCESDGQTKLKDGTITVEEFFKLFNIDFVIHNPRQSVLPGKILSDTEVTSLDLLKERHISHPKQKIYEMDIQTLTEKVDGLKVRMQDLHRPLMVVNGPLWEEIRHFSENEIRCFGAKLKERNNFFRKLSKVQSHEMKEVLYSNLVQANLEEQHKLRGMIGEADEMIKSLDGCICELEAELSAIEEKGSENNPSIKTLQEELTKVTEAVADKERQTSELEVEKNENSSKLSRVKAETRNLENNINVLNMMNEWRLREEEDNCVVYTFLYETMLLQLVYEKSDGNDPDGESEEKITNITFKFELDGEKSQFHARLVHKMISQFINGESAWVEKYPTRKHVPKLLHDVSLVVSRCRLLGDELCLLKMWGGLRFDILDISCTDTQVNIVFSSLKTLSKFEVVFNVSLTNQVCGIQVHSFKNMIGNTSMQQIEEIVASQTPERNLLTKVIRKIHASLLS